MKFMNQVRLYAGGLVAKFRENTAYLVPAGAGVIGGLLLVPRPTADSWALFSFEMSAAMTGMMAMAENIFNAMVGAFSNIWGIALGFGILGIVSAAIFAVVKIRQK
jgi:hypothetical protein